MEKQKFTIQSYSQKELRQLYNVTNKTFNRWIKPIKNLIGAIEGKRYTPKQVKMIVEHLDPPAPYNE